MPILCEPQIAYTGPQYAIYVWSVPGIDAVIHGYHCLMPNKTIGKGLAVLNDSSVFYPEM